MDEGARFLAKIRQKQRELGLTNTQFAHEIGVSRQMWAMTVSDHRPIRLGLTVARAALGRFEDLCPDFIRWARAYEHGLTVFARRNGVEAEREREEVAG